HKVRADLDERSNWLVDALGREDQAGEYLIVLVGFRVSLIALTRAHACDCRLSDRRAEREERDRKKANAAAISSRRGFLIETGSLSDQHDGNPPMASRLVSLEPTSSPVQPRVSAHA